MGQTNILKPFFGTYTCRSSPRGKTAVRIEYQKIVKLFASKNKNFHVD